jgi:sulfate/thiosulfate transport system substrate-binding protein
MRSRRPAAVLAAFVILALAACAPSRPGGGGATTLTLVAYSTPKEAYQALIAAFQKTEAGKGVGFTQSYGASGEQSRAVASGLKADVVAFSLAPDMSRLVKANLVAADWAKDRFGGMVTDSVVVLVVRRGNPKGIRTWDDLVKPGVDVVTPNPFTSGGARWNVLAAYGARIEQGRSPAEAEQYLRQLFRHVSVQDKSAREALQTFSGGKGDVMIAYENEAITAEQKHLAVDYVVPDQTILIENPVAVVTSSKHQEKARAFVDFLHSPEAQRIFAEKGYRPVLGSALRAAGYPTPSGLFKIGDVGGWTEVSKTFFDPDTGIMAKVEAELGVSTASK